MDALGNEQTEETAVSYTYQGKDKVMYYKTLENGMKFVLTAPKTELQEKSRQLAKQIFGGAAFAMILTIIIGTVLGFTITKPITQIDGIVKQTAEFEFASNRQTSTFIKEKNESRKNGDITSQHAQESASNGSKYPSCIHRSEKYDRTAF